MSRAFRRHGERIEMRLDEVEVDLLRRLQGSLRELLESGHADDPVMRRLFPATVRGDEEADAELRGMIHDDLLRDRLAGLDELTALLERGRSRGRRWVVDDLDEAEAVLVLGVLNDIRLAIGAQVGIEHLDVEHLDPEDPVTYRLAVMGHFAGLQSALLEVLDPPSVRVEKEDEA